jgi:hypothetical protein
MGKLPYVFASRNRKQWIAIFQEIYGYPYCEICGMALLWYSPTDKRKSVHWDHRKGESYSRAPFRWISEHPATKENVKKFLELDLGILCNQCNFYLGKNPNRRWAKPLRMNLYLKGKTPHEMAKLEKRKRYTTNSILAFLNQRCIRTKSVKDKWAVRDFYKEYEKFCAGEDFVPIGEKKIITQLEYLGITVGRGPKYLSYIYGWRLDTSVEMEERKEISRLLDLPPIERKKTTRKRQRHEKATTMPQITDLGGPKPLIEDSFEMGPDGKKIYTHPDHPKAKGDNYEKYPNSDPSLFDILAHIEDVASHKPHEQSQDEWESTLKLIIETLEPVLDDIYASPKEKAERSEQIHKLREGILKDKEKKMEELQDLVNEFIKAYLSVNPK